MFGYTIEIKKKSSDAGEKITSSKKGWSGSPHRRDPELYYRHVWVDRQTFDLIKIFSYWENISLKSAVFHLLKFGLHFYVVQQLNLEQARLTHTIAEHTELYSVEDLARLIKHVGKAKKLMGNEIKPDDEPPA